MSAKTGIQWTDHTFNIAWGCTKVSPGCANCYADRDATRYGFDIWGPGKDRRLFGEKHWNEPRKWNRAAEKAGVRARVFCSSMADVFEDHKDLRTERFRLLRLIAETPWLDWQVLTKRAKGMRDWFNYIDSTGLAPDGKAKERGAKYIGEAEYPWPLANLWLGVSVENQETADERIPHLLATPAAVRFLSVEPLLGPIDLRFCEGSSICFDRDPDEDSPVATIACPSGRHWVNQFEHVIHTCGIDWVIVGGESGPGARPCDISWIRSIVAQCKAAGVPAFVKQLGGRATFANTLTDDWPQAGWPAGATKQLSLGIRDRKGGDPSEWPEDLRVREMP